MEGGSKRSSLTRLDFSSFPFTKMLGYRHLKRYTPYMKEKLGIDAGGSKTRAILGTDLSLSEGRYQEEILPAGNIASMGMVDVADLVTKAVHRLGIGNPADTLVVAGFAGLSTPEQHAVVEEAFIRNGFERSLLRITSDAELVARAIPEGSILMILGTGGILCGKYGPESMSHGKIIRVGGYGFRADSEVSRYFFGRRALDFVFRIHDGVENRKSSLYELVLCHFGVDDIPHIKRLLYPTSPEGMREIQPFVGQLADGVIEAAGDGDLVAQDIVEEAIKSLYGFVTALTKKLSRPQGELPISCHGGIFRINGIKKLLLEPLSHMVSANGFKVHFSNLGVFSEDPDPLVEVLKREQVSFIDEYSILDGTNSIAHGWE